MVFAGGPCPGWARGKDLLSHSRHGHPGTDVTAQEHQHLHCSALPQSYTATDPFNSRAGAVPVAGKPAECNCREGWDGRWGGKGRPARSFDSYLQKSPAAHARCKVSAQKRPVAGPFCRAQHSKESSQDLEKDCAKSLNVYSRPRSIPWRHSVPRCFCCCRPLCPQAPQIHVKKVRSWTLTSKLSDTCVVRAAACWWGSSNYPEIPQHLGILIILPFPLIFYHFPFIFCFSHLPFLLACKLSSNSPCLLPDQTREKKR